MDRYTVGGRVYEVLGLCRVATLRLNGQMPLLTPSVGDDGLGGRMFNDRRDDSADVSFGRESGVEAVSGELLKYVELGREGDACGTISFEEDSFL